MFKTTAAYVSGGICGHLWMPAVLAGTTIHANLRGPFGFLEKGESLADGLSALLNRNGGDFQNAQFTSDTVLRIERRAIDSPGKYRIHVRELEIGKLAPALVRADSFVADFMGDE